MTIVGRLTDGRILINDFVGGGRIIRPRHNRRMDEDVVWNRALWLSNQGRLQEAEDLLDAYVQGDSLLIRH